MNQPEHEQLKRELMEKFNPTTTYVGSHIRLAVQQTDFKGLKSTTRPTSIRKGDVIVSFEGVKSRPSVVVNVLKDRTVLYIPLTSTENVHCLSESKSRFFGEGCFCKAFSVCTEEFAIEHFVGVYDNNKLLNQAIKQLKEYLNKNL